MNIANGSLLTITLKSGLTNMDRLTHAGEGSPMERRRLT